MNMLRIRARGGALLLCVAAASPALGQVLRRSRARHGGLGAAQGNAATALSEQKAPPSVV